MHYQRSITAEMFWRFTIS